MLVAFAKDLTEVARAGTGAAEVYCDPQPVGDANYAEVTLNAHVLFAVGGSDPQLTVQAQGSNDGVNWFDYSGLTLVALNPILYQDGDYVTSTFLRFKYSLTSTGSGDNLAVATFDLHANLTRK
jgi:hypothetical protein